MKKSAAVLGIIALLLISACHAPVGETTRPTPPTATQPATAPGQTKPVPQETQPSAPPVTVTPTQEVPLTPEQAQAAAQEWCGNNRMIFSHAEAYTRDRALWFAEYTPGMTMMPFVPGDAYFYEDATGTMSADAVAAELSNQAMANAPAAVLDWAQVQTQLIATATAEPVTQTALETKLTALAERCPALGEGMWLVTYPPEVNGKVFSMIKHGNLYRLQENDAFAAYAQSPRMQVRLDYKKAHEAYAWFEAVTMPLSAGDTATYNGTAYNRVEYPGISTLTDLRFYLKNLFSDEIVDELLPADQTHYVEIDGVLYSYDAGRGIEPTKESYTVISESDTRLIFHVEVDYFTIGEAPVVREHRSFDFPYEQVGEKWVFTDFNMIG